MSTWSSPTSTPEDNTATASPFKSVKLVSPPPVPQQSAVAPSGPSTSPSMPSKASVPSEEMVTLADALAVGGFLATVSVRPPPRPLPVEVPELQTRVLELEAEAARLATTLAHYRQNAAQVEARYHLLHSNVVLSARRIYVNGLPPDTSDGDLRAAVNSLLVIIGGAIGPGDPVVSATHQPGRSYAFLEMRSVEEASNVLALDGVPYRGGRLHVRRPNNYDAAAAATFGPTEPDPGVDAVKLGAVRTTVPDDPDKVFVGGLPCDWNAGRVKALLAPYGQLTAFNLVMDKTTGNSRGYAFCQFADPASADYAIATLHGLEIGSRALTVKRALDPPMGHD